MLATAPLWGIGGGSLPDLPHVGWFRLAGGLSQLAVFNGGLLAVVLVGLVAAMSGFHLRLAWAVAGIALAGLIALDQQRLQPWAYQSLAYAGIFSVLPWRSGRRWVIAITVSIYAYSALGKFDFQFLHTVGQDFVTVFAHVVGDLDPAVASRLAIAMPTAELTIAILLAIPQSRRWGGWLAIGMHGMLIVLLGPWWLGHSWGVLCWNAVLAMQSGLLFVRAPKITPADQTKTPGLLHSCLGWGLRAGLLLMLVLPMFERSGYWDHWTSWALYSPHNSRVEIQIHASVAEKLPAELHPYLVSDEFSGRWQTLDIEGWSFDRRGAPVYPQARYQLAIASALADRYGLESAVRVKVKEVADRWSGRRDESFLIGQQEIDRFIRSHYWLVP